jgi:hypothetical protein
MDPRVAMVLGRKELGLPEATCLATDPRTRTQCRRLVCRSSSHWRFGAAYGASFLSWPSPFLRGPAEYWIGAIIFGAIFPTFVAWFVVFPLKGLPAGRGFHLPGIFVGPIVNGLWGLGTAIFLRLTTQPAARLQYRS